MARRQHRDRRCVVDLHAVLLFSEPCRRLHYIVHPHDGLEAFDATTSRLAFTPSFQQCSVAVSPSFPSPEIHIVPNPDAPCSICTEPVARFAFASCDRAALAPSQRRRPRTPSHQVATNLRHPNATVEPLGGRGALLHPDVTAMFRVVTSIRHNCDAEPVRDHTATAI